MDYICLTVNGHPRLSWLAVPPSTTPAGRNFTVSSVAYTAAADIVRRSLGDSPFTHVGLTPNARFRLDTPTKRVLGKLQDLTNALPMKGFLCFDATQGFLATPLTGANAAIDRFDWTVTTLIDWDGLPLALSNAGRNDPPSTSTVGQQKEGVTTSLPSPGYWPIQKVFVDAGQSALKNSLASGQFNAQVCNGLGTFLRDLRVNLCHVDGAGLHQENISTTKCVSSFPNLDHLVGIAVPPKIAQSGYGFGGNFLTVERPSKPPCLVYGRSDQQVGSLEDDAFMLAQIVQRLGRPVTLLGVETGWLKVGHVDELLSFPAAGHALIASTKRYRELVATNATLADEPLNTAIQLRLDKIKTALQSLDLDVKELPVWFRLCADDAMHVTAVRGNAVNCLYDAVRKRSIHAASGPANSQVVNQEVETVLAQFGYTASFVDMSAANDEGGGGGNVHCATFSTHVPPS